MVKRKRPILLKKKKLEKNYFGYIIGLFLINSNKCLYYNDGRWVTNIKNAAILDKADFDKAIKRMNNDRRRFKQIFSCKCNYGMGPIGPNEHWNSKTNRYEKNIGKVFKSLTRLHPFQALEHLIYKL